MRRFIFACFMFFSMSSFASQDAIMVDVPRKLLLEKSFYVNKQLDWPELLELYKKYPGKFSDWDKFLFEQELKNPKLNDFLVAARQKSLNLDNVYCLLQKTFMSKSLIQSDPKEYMDEFSGKVSKSFEDFLSNKKKKKQISEIQNFVSHSFVLIEELNKMKIDPIPVLLYCDKGLYRPDPTSLYEMVLKNQKEKLSQNQLHFLSYKKELLNDFDSSKKYLSLVTNSEWIHEDKLRFSEKIGLPVDSFKYRDLAENGSFVAMVLYADIKDREGEEKVAIEWYQKAIDTAWENQETLKEKGDSAILLLKYAQNRLTKYYDKGLFNSGDNPIQKYILH